MDKFISPTVPEPLFNFTGFMASNLVGICAAVSG